MAPSFLVLLFFALLSLFATSAVACDGAPPIESRIVSHETQAAEESVEQLVRSAGADANLRAIRASVLSSKFPSADVDVTSRRMLSVYCEVVRGDRGLDEAQKMERISSANGDILRPIQGPSEVARTNSRLRRNGHSDLEGALILAMTDEITSSAVLSEYTPLARPVTVAATTAATATSANDDEEFLADTPSFVNESNRYFVVVGSAISEAAAVKLMNDLSRKAPGYDFVVFLPYGGNQYYGVMMAKWVSKNTALRALYIARAKVARDAYLWACPSMGDSC